MPDQLTIAIVGATGAVGREAMAILAERGWPADRLAVFASPASDGMRAPYGDADVRIRAFDPRDAARATCALLCAGASFSKGHARALAAGGATVIDNSSAFRMDPHTPLVIPEINGCLLRRGAPPRLIANPNCSTILLLSALEPLRGAFGIEDVSVSTYQAASGAGRAAMAELLEQTRAALDGQPAIPAGFPEPCAFNIFPHESAVDPETGANVEERKIIDESRRIWENQSLSIAPTCVRVPVLRAHSLSIDVTLRRPATSESALDMLRAAPGLRVLEDPRTPPTPARATGQDDVLVGRVRPRPGSVNGRGESRRFLLWVCGDQLSKGAALNALQIAAIAHPEMNLGRGVGATSPQAEETRRGGIAKIFHLS